MATTTQTEVKAKTATVSESEFTALKEELVMTKEELTRAKAVIDQYEKAYKAQGEKYNNLFGLFAHTVDYVVAGQQPAPTEARRDG